jgi:hypothetical protein
VCFFVTVFVCVCVVGACVYVGVYVCVSVCVCVGVGVGVGVTEQNHFDQIPIDKMFPEQKSLCHAQFSVKTGQESR